MQESLPGHDPRRSEFREYIFGLPIVDVHEHHIPAIFLNPDVGILDLIRQSYVSWTQTYGGGAMMGPGDWTELAGFLEKSGSNAFVRNLLRGICDIYDVGAEGITERNWREIDARIRARHRDPFWVSTLMKGAGVMQIITDVYPDPVLDVRPALGENYRSVFRMNAFALGWHPRSCDHNGNCAADLARKLGLKLDSFEDIQPAIQQIVATLAARGQVGVKNALAYDCDLTFDPPNPGLARRAWGNPDPEPLERKGFIDFVVDAFCVAAGDYNIPMQMHLGTARLRGSHPLNVAGLIERHPRTRFLLMHLAYPWSSELLAMAFAYRNIWIDLSWSFLLSPSHFERAFAEAIEVLPDESRMMLGGDNWHAEETCAAIGLGRRLIADVLEARIAKGYFREEDARRLARKIFFENAISFFGLRPFSESGK